MGKALSYCSHCSTLIREDDLDAGRAFRLSDRVICAPCSDATGVKPQPASSRSIAMAKGASGSTRRIRIETPPPGPRPHLIIAGAAGLVLVVGLALMMSGGSSKPPDLEPVRPNPPPPIKPVSVTPDPNAAREKERLKGLLAELEESVDRAVAKKDFDAALKLCEEAAARKDAPEIAFAAKRRIKPIREEIARRVESTAVARWSFDEGQGAAVTDASGNGVNATIKKATWAPGKLGSGLEFNGKDSVVEIAPGKLDKIQEDSYTLTAWFKPETFPPNKSNNDSSFGIIMKPGYHEGLAYNAAGNVEMLHWLKGNQNVTTETTGDPVRPGEFTHVAGVVDRAGGTTKVYVNGVLRTTRTWTAGSAAKDFAKAPWRIGCANPGASTYAWPARGIIDEVRFYNRALSEAEIKSLNP